MAEIQPSPYVPLEGYSDFDLIDIEPEKVMENGETMRISDENITLELANITEQYDFLVENFQGESGEQYKNAMMTFYGIADHLSNILKNSCEALQDFSNVLTKINEDA